MPDPVNTTSELLFDSQGRGYYNPDYNPASNYTPDQQWATSIDPSFSILNNDALTGLRNAVKSAGLTDEQFTQIWQSLPADQRASLTTELDSGTRSNRGMFGWGTVHQADMIPVLGRITAAVQNAAKNQADKARSEQEHQGLTNQIAEFANMMKQDIQDPVTHRYVDSYAAQLADVGSSNAAQKVNNSGFSSVGGGYSANAGLAGTRAALAPYQAQRAGLASQAMGLLNNRQVSLDQLSLQRQQLELQRNQAQQAASYRAWQAGVAQDQGVVGTVAGIGGAIVAGVASGGNPAAIQGGFQTMSSLGGGLAGSGNSAPQGPSMSGGSNGGWYGG